MPFEIWLKSLPENSSRHVKADLDLCHLDYLPFLQHDLAGYQIERMSLHLGLKPVIIRQAAIRYSLYVRQLDGIQGQEHFVRQTCAQACPRPPVGCCNGEHHIFFSFSDVMFARPTQDALHLAHVLTNLQEREHDHALRQGRLVRPEYCSRLTATGCSLRMFKSPRCIHYLCPHLIEDITQGYGEKAVPFLDAMQATSTQVILGIQDFTNPVIIPAAEILFDTPRIFT